MDNRLPFRLRAAPEFDFDEWSALYRNDPIAFEARRSALIAIELARGRQYTAPTARMLLDLQERSAGLTPDQRLHLATEAMLESGRMLAHRLGEMSDELTRLGADPHEGTGQRAPLSSPIPTPAKPAAIAPVDAAPMPAKRPAVGPMTGSSSNSVTGPATGPAGPATRPAAGQTTRPATGLAADRPTDTGRATGNGPSIWRPFQRARLPRQAPFPGLLHGPRRPAGDDPAPPASSPDR